MTRFLIKPDLPFYLSGLAGKGICSHVAISAIYTPLSQLHIFCLNLRIFVAICDILCQSMRLCCNFCKFVAIYAFLSWCQRFCDLRVLGAKKKL